MENLVLLVVERLESSQVQPKLVVLLLLVILVEMP
jgi:hypothetical protein